MPPKNKDSRPDKIVDFGVMREYAKKTLNEIIYDDLKEKILKGAISMEDRLQEDNLAKNYETSRTPIRDALRRLEQENIVQKLSYGGYQIKYVPIEEIEEIFGIRGVLESYAALLASRRITEAEIEKMEALLKQSRQAIDEEDFEAFAGLDSEFHECLYNASRSPHLLRILRNLWDHFIRYRKFAFFARSNMEISLKDHQILLKKIKEGDKRAIENIVREHVDRAMRNMKKGLKGKE